MTSVSPAWASRTFEAGRAWLDRGPVELHGRFARVSARLSPVLLGEPSLADALTSPTATPFIALLEAYRSDLFLPEEGSITAVGEGALALYLHLRIQDDIVDEPSAFDPSFVYAAEVLAAKSVEAFATVAGARPAFWSFRRAVLDELAAVSAWEIDTYRAMPLAEAAARVEEHTARLGAKLAPIGVPIAALASSPERDRPLAWIDPFSRAFGAGLQIVNDLHNARDDHAARRRTPVLAALYSECNLDPDGEPHRVWPLLFGSATLPRMLALSEAHHRRAAALADDAGAPSVAGVVARRLDHLRDVGPTILRLALGARAR